MEKGCNAMSDFCNIHNFVTLILSHWFTKMFLLSFFKDDLYFMRLQSRDLH